LSQALNVANKKQQQQQQQHQQGSEDGSNDWPSAQHQHQHQQNGSRSRSPQEEYGYNQNPRDSHHSNHSANGGGYSVSNTQKYLGQPATHGGQSESDTAKSGDDDMW
jgi:hypothetical protein